jgi:hypothetical protein
MKKYKARYSTWGPELVEVEVARETDSSVFISRQFGGQARHAKRSNGDNYFDTWEEAHAYLMAQALDDLNTARKQLERVQGAFGNVKGMKNPGIS